jgi:FkbM family methyltransferase
MSLPKLKSILRKFLDFAPDAHATKSYSQEGEDVLLNRVLAEQPEGFYVDVGACHPQRFSNTCLFYQRGWSGINIEPNPDAAGAFRSSRPRDINLCLGISDRPGTLTYYQFDEPALNTMDQDLARWREEHTRYRVVKTLQVPVETLADVLAKYLPPRRTIDFLTVDVEGHDFAVLQSNDWVRFRPRYILTEALGKSMEEAISGEIAQFLKGRGYVLFAKTFNTLFFGPTSQDGGKP